MGRNGDAVGVVAGPADWPKYSPLSLRDIPPLGGGRLPWVAPLREGGGGIAAGGSTPERIHVDRLANAHADGVEMERPVAAASDAGEVKRAVVEVDVNGVEVLLPGRSFLPLREVLAPGR